jgi:hypothetical protein
MSVDALIGVSTEFGLAEDLCSPKTKPTARPISRVPKASPTSVIHRGILGHRNGAIMAISARAMPAIPIPRSNITPAYYRSSPVPI